MSDFRYEPVCFGALDGFIFFHMNDKNKRV